jgi:NAD(P)-dependent dehydrogenase (short-subunit alcohol dehydrogenase family)
MKARQLVRTADALFKMALARRRRRRQSRLRKGLVLLGVGAGVALALWRSRPRYRFTGRSVVITGGSRGLGLALARELAHEGAHLTLLARDGAALERARVDLAGITDQVLVIPCDVRAQRQVNEAIARVVDRFGQIDVLINNAGVIQAGPIEHMTIQDFADAMAVHLWGSLYTSLAAVPHMRRQGGGRIVNIASIGGLVAVPHLLPYTTSKFALVGLSNGMRAELAKDRIRVTTVCPGLMRTGSHINAQFKGRHALEFAWFSLLDSLPLTATDARRAAREIIEACRAAKSQLVITPQAKMMHLVESLLPELTAAGMAMMNRVLPGPDGGQGDAPRLGRDVRPEGMPAWLTAMADRASADYNELPRPAEAGVETPIDRPNSF